MNDDQLAVQSYLDELLAEVGPASAAVGAVAPRERTLASRYESAKQAVVDTPVQTRLESLERVKRAQLQALLDQTISSAPAPEIAVAVPVVSEFRSTPVAEPLPAAAEPVVAKAEPVPALLAWGENGRPLWAQESFDVLLFRVAGLTLAVPLVALGHIHPLTEELAPIFGQAEWFMGLQPTPAGRIRTINTALFVMPERYDPSFVKTARYVISIDGLDWGLAVDQVQQPTRLNPDDVTWRNERTKRPWLAGTVKTAMCALLDIPQMGRLFESLDRKRAIPSD